jgi:hypothetical protein
VLPQAINSQRDLPYAGADIYRLNLATRAIEQLTHGEFTLNTRAGTFDESNPVNPARNRGVVQITLKPGLVDKGRIGVKAKGASLTLPTLPLASPSGTTLQLRRDDDTSRCWQASFPLSRRNDASVFSARLP